MRARVGKRLLTGHQSVEVTSMGTYISKSRCTGSSCSWLCFHITVVTTRCRPIIYYCRYLLCLFHASSPVGPGTMDVPGR